MNDHIFISFDEARRIALREADVSAAEFQAQCLCAENGRGLYELDYSTEYMEYCCYVSAEDGAVLGFDLRPRVA